VAAIVNYCLKLRGAGIPELYPELGILILITLLTLALAILRFRKRLD